MQSQENSPGAFWDQFGTKISFKREGEGLKESQIYVVGQWMQVHPWGHGDKKKMQGNRTAPALQMNLSRYNDVKH